MRTWDASARTSRPFQLCAAAAPRAMTPTGVCITKREYIHRYAAPAWATPVLFGASAAPALPSAPLDPEPSPPLAPSPEPCPASRARPTPPLSSAGWAPPPPLPPSSSSCSHCGPWTAGSSAAPANGTRPGAAGAAPASVTPSGATWQTRTQHIGQSLKPGSIAVYALHLTLPLEGPRQRPHLLRLQTKQALLPQEQGALMLLTLRQVSALDLPSDRIFAFPLSHMGQGPFLSGTVPVDRVPPAHMLPNGHRVSLGVRARLAALQRALC